MSERMVHLTTVASPFHGRVLAARLGAEGILTDLRGAISGTYPLPGLVEVWVEEPAAPLALGLLDADHAASVASPPRTEVAAEPVGDVLGELGGDSPGERILDTSADSLLATGLGDAYAGGRRSGEAIGNWAGSVARERRPDALVHPRPFGHRLTWLVAGLLLAVALLSAVRLG
jgi:hypothetical protein